MARVQPASATLTVIPAASPTVFFVTSTRQPGAYYRVNAAQRACSCPDWVYRQRTRTDGTGLCKHLVAVEAAYPGTLSARRPGTRP